MEKQIKIAATLYQCRDMAKRFFKDDFNAKIEPYKQIILKFNGNNGTDTARRIKLFANGSQVALVATLTDALD